MERKTPKFLAGPDVEKHLYKFMNPCEPAYYRSNKENYNNAKNAIIKDILKTHEYLSSEISARLFVDLNPFFNVLPGILDFYTRKKRPLLEVVQKILETFDQVQLCRILAELRKYENRPGYREDIDRIRSLCSQQGKRLEVLNAILNSVYIRERARFNMEELIKELVTRVTNFIEDPDEFRDCMVKILSVFPVPILCQAYHWQELDVLRMLESMSTIPIYSTISNTD